MSAAVLLVPDGDRLSWLAVAHRYCLRTGMTLDAVTSDPATAARLHQGGWTVLTSTWRMRLDPFRLVDLDRPSDDGDGHPAGRRPQRLSRTRSVERARWND